MPNTDPGNNVNNPSDPRDSRLATRAESSDPGFGALVVPNETKQCGLVVVQAIAPRELGPVLLRDTSYGAGTLIEDEDIISELARTPAYGHAKLSSLALEAAKELVRQDIRNIETISAGDVTRRSANQIVWGLRAFVRDLQKRIEKELEEGPPDADSFSDTIIDVVDTVIDAPDSSKPVSALQDLENKQYRLVYHAASILNMIQRAAATLNDESIWDSFSKFLEVYDDSLAMKLKDLSSSDPRIRRASSEDLFQDLLHRAESLLHGRDAAPSLLIGNLILKRYVHLIEDGNAKQRESTEQQKEDPFDLRDTIAIYFAQQLATELNNPKAQERYLSTLMVHSPDSAMRFFEQIITAFMKFGKDDFPTSDSISLPASDRDRHRQRGRAVDAIKSLAACACLLWPDKFSRLLKTKMGSASINHRSTFAFVLKYGVEKDPRRIEYVIEENLALFSETARGGGAFRPNRDTAGFERIQKQAAQVLREFADPLLAYLGQEESRRYFELPVDVQSRLLWDVLIPSCDPEKGDPKRSVMVYPLFENQIKDIDLTLFKKLGVASLFSKELVQTLQPTQKDKLLRSLFEAYVNHQADPAVRGSLGVDTQLPLEVLVAQYKPMIEAFGVLALQRGVTFAESLRVRQPMESMAVISLLGSAAPSIEVGSDREKAALRELILKTITPRFVASANAKAREVGLLSGLKMEQVPPPRSEVTPAAIDDRTPHPEGGEQDLSMVDMDSELEAVLREEAEEPDVQENVGPIFGTAEYLAKALVIEGKAFRGFLSNACVDHDTAVRVHGLLNIQEIEAAISRFSLELRFGLRQEGLIDADRQLGQIGISYCLANGDEEGVLQSQVTSLLRSMTDVMREAGPLWEKPSDSMFYRFIVHGLNEPFKSGFRLSKPEDLHRVWGNTANIHALQFLTAWHERLPPEKREPLEVLFLRVVKTWIKNYSAAEKHTLPEESLVRCLRETFTNGSDKKFRLYTTYLFSQKLIDEEKKGSLKQKAPWVQSDALPFLKMTRDMTQSTDTIEISRGKVGADDRRSEVREVLPLIRTAIAMLEEKYAPSGTSKASTGRTVGERQIPVIDFQFTDERGGGLPKGNDS